MLLPLSRLGLLVGGETGDQHVDLAQRLLVLLVHQTDAGDQGCDVGAGGRGGAAARRRGGVRNL